MPGSTPGIMPARNSLLMDTLAATPKITKPMDGNDQGDDARRGDQPRDSAANIMVSAATIARQQQRDASAAASATAEPGPPPKSPPP